MLAVWRAASNEILSGLIKYAGLGLVPLPLPQPLLCNRPLTTCGPQPHEKPSVHSHLPEDLLKYGKSYGIFFIQATCAVGTLRDVDYQMTTFYQHTNIIFNLFELSCSPSRKFAFCLKFLMSYSVFEVDVFATNLKDMSPDLKRTEFSFAKTISFQVEMKFAWLHLPLGKLAEYIHLSNADFQIYFGTSSNSKENWPIDCIPPHPLTPNVCVATSQNAVVWRLPFGSLPTLGQPPDFICSQRQGKRQKGKYCSRSFFSTWSC